MIKHQRRAHQQGLQPGDMSETYDMDSDYVESPHTPYQPAGVTWPLQVVPEQGPMPDGVSLADVAHSDSEYSLASPYRRRSSASQVSMVALDMEAPSAVHVQHEGSGMSKSPVYVADQGKSGMAAMHTSSIPRTYYVGHAQDDRPRIDMGFPVHEIRIPEEQSPGGMSAASAQSSNFVTESCSGQSISSAASSFYDAPSVDDQTTMVQYAQHPPHGIDHAAPQGVGFHNKPTAIHQAQAGFHHHPAAPGVALWGEYQPSPMEMTTIGHMPAFGSGMFGLYLEPKLDFDDPSMQLPSARLECL